MASVPDTLSSPQGSPGQRDLPGRGDREDRTKFAFLLPAAVWILIFTIFPLLYAIYTSFWSFRFGTFNQMVGFDNYVRLFTDKNLHSALWVTIYFVVVTVSVEMILGFGFAILFNREVKGKNVMRAIMTLPLFATPVAMGYLGITLYYESNGPINEFIKALGGEGIPWLSNPASASNCSREPWFKKRSGSPRLRTVTCTSFRARNSFTALPAPPLSALSSMVTSIS